MIRIKNWQRFQHYQDRNPPWIKLYHSIIDDVDWHLLDPFVAKNLVMMWLVASEDRGNLPCNKKLAFRLRITEDELKTVIDGLSRWIEEGEYKEPETKWASRYISPDVRELILEKYNRACNSCGSTENIEIDHIIPISKGGDSRAENLQTLCRPCNRSKRHRLTEQVATQEINERSLETETETETETEKKKPTRFAPPTLDEVSQYCKSRNNIVDPIKFHAFYSSKGWKVGRSPMKDWRACVVTWERGN